VNLQFNFDPASHGGVLFPFGSGTAWDRFLALFLGDREGVAVRSMHRSAIIHVRAAFT
jgi:hypothetical protein